METNSGMTFIVKNISKIVAIFIFLFGPYIVLYGHLTPGGGFAGGVIIAIGFVLLGLAFGKDFVLSILPDFWASMWDNIGAFLFFLVALLGLPLGYFFFNWLWHGTPFQLVSAGTIPLSNIAIGIKVGACLYAIFLGLSIYGSIVAEEQKEE
ncbi:MAG: MnhB domain-containing protein [bacterium]